MWLQILLVSLKNQKKKKENPGSQDLLVTSDNTSVCTSNVKLLGLNTKISVQFNFCFKCFYELAISKWTTDKQTAPPQRLLSEGRKESMQRYQGVRPCSGYVETKEFIKSHLIVN